jgi:hypothetical protein
MIVVEILAYLGRAFWRWRDRNMASGASLTKCLSFYQYVEIYGGPVFDLNSQYAMVLNIVFVTMMYATAIPVLLPVAFLNLIVFYGI